MTRTTDPIEQRALDRAGTATSILGLSTRRLAGAGQQATIKTVREAIDRGVTMLELAPEYGDGRTERWVGMALREGYRDRVKLLWQCCAHRRDYKTAMIQLEETLQHLHTDRVEMWSFHEVIYDNDPDWMYDHGGLDAAQEARVQGKVRQIAFHCEKSPHIALKVLARGFGWDAVLMPLNPFDASFRSFEKQVLPEVIRRGGVVIGTQPLAGGSIPGCKVVKAEDAFRYAWSLPVACVLADVESGADLRKTLRMATTFKPFHPGEMDAMRQRARTAAGDGRHEHYKTTQSLDGAAGRAAHGF
ncbi:MAG: aldo/keto reductase [Gemmatimonadaceae bacterium]